MAPANLAMALLDVVRNKGAPDLDGCSVDEVAWLRPVAEAKEYVGDGYGVVVDIDFSKFFDRIHHHRLLGRLGQKVADSRILKPISRMLKANGVMPDCTRVFTDEGTPQCDPLSPLRSNVVLDEFDEFDKELARRGLRFVRYSNDCNIFMRSERDGQRVMGSIREFL